MSHSRKPVALLSVSDKDGIIDFGKGLKELGWDLISSGGTKKALDRAGVPSTDVAEITKLPPMLAHRVVTLHPAIHGGLLATEELRPELEQLGYPWIDLVCVDFYALEGEVNNPNATRESVIEKTDIGGPTMIRAGAKGRRIVICDANLRKPVLQWLKDGRPNEEKVLDHLVGYAEAKVAAYCLESAEYHSRGRVKGSITWGDGSAASSPYILPT